MRRQQQRREVALFSKGLYLVESRTLKSVPLSAPYFKNLINDRIKLKRMAIKRGWNATQLEKAVRLSYEAKVGLQRGQKLDKGIIFKLLRWYENNWRDTAPPDEVDRWISPSAKKSHHGSNLSREKYLKQKREYNNREDVKEKRRQYRLKHRDQIAEQRRKLKEYKRNQGKI